MNGIDYSLWRPPSTEWLQQQGVTFVCRYLAYLPNPKVIDRAEFELLKTAGVAVVLVWENGAKDMLGGWVSGSNDGRAAVLQAQALGAWPCPVYYAADWDVQDAEQVQVSSYLLGCAQVMGDPRLVGVYGGLAVVQRQMQAHHAAYGWQTTAWSGGIWYAGAQLRQLAGGTANYDLDLAMVTDYGQVPGTGRPVPVPRATGFPRTNPLYRGWPTRSKA